MKKLLYITANSKPEELSSSKTVARSLLNAILNKNPNISVDELDLYKDHIPRLEYQYFESRSTIITEDKRKELNADQQKEVDRIIALCDQFIKADIYILAAPMWSLSFPAPVKEYFDCVIQSGKSIAFDDNKPYGILDDKKREFVYVQSSGAGLPWIIRPALNKGLNYIQDIVKFIGVSSFHELLVDSTGTTEDERQKAVAKATEKIELLVDNIIK